MPDSSKAWTTVFKDQYRAIIPLNDLDKHFEFSPICPCHPKLMPAEDFTLIVHNSWDGREYFEDNNEKYGLIN